MMSLPVAVALPARLTAAALARALGGVSRQAIHDLVKRGILAKGVDGLIDVEQARAAIANSLRPSSKISAALRPVPQSSVMLPAAQLAPQADQASDAGADDATDPDLPADFPSGDPDTPAAASYHAAKALRETMEAHIARLKLQQMRGEMLPREDCRRAFAQVGRTVRDQLESARRRLAPDLAAARNAQDCEEILRLEHQQLLANLVTAFAQAVAVGPLDLLTTAQGPQP